MTESESESEKDIETEQHFDIDVSWKTQWNGHQTNNPKEKINEGKVTDFISIDDL